MAGALHRAKELEMCDKEMREKFEAAASKKYPWLTFAKAHDGTYLATHIIDLYKGFLLSAQEPAMKEQMRAELKKVIAAFEKFHEIAGGCDGWESFPRSDLESAEEAIESAKAALSAVPANHKLTQAVNALAAQTGESPESITEWLCDKGGLTQLMLSHFGGMQSQAQQTESQWVSVDERLPEGYKPVLVATNFGDVYTCRLPVIIAKNSKEELSVGRRERFTHWMPLPPAPEGDKP